MSKVLFDHEVADVIRRIVCDHDEYFAKPGAYMAFLQDLSMVIADYFGGQVPLVEHRALDDNWVVKFNVDKEVPADGGVYAHYDTDVTWVEGKEVRRG